MNARAVELWDGARSIVRFPSDQAQSGRQVRKRRLQLAYHAVRFVRQANRAPKIIRHELLDDATSKTLANGRDDSRSAVFHPQELECRNAIDRGRPRNIDAALGRR